MPNPRKQDRELDALYATLPKLTCQGYCHDSCGPIDMSLRERQRIVQRARKPVECPRGALCSMLDEQRRCSVYEIRPMVCRLWGLVRSMPCQYGCRPDGGLLSDAEGVRLLVQSERLGGSPLGDTRQRLAEETLASLSEDELARAAVEIVGKGRGTLEGRIVALQRSGVRAVFEQPGLPIDEHGLAFPKPTDDR
jgi:hypothetical protein